MAILFLLDVTLARGVRHRSVPLRRVRHSGIAAPSAGVRCRRIREQARSDPSRKKWPKVFERFACIAAARYNSRSRLHLGAAFR
jgi:hypothetical protein